MIEKHRLAVPVCLGMVLAYGCAIISVSIRPEAFWVVVPVWIVCNSPTRDILDLCFPSEAKMCLTMH